MENKIYYVIPTYKSFDLAFNGILAAMRGTVVPTSIIVIDNSGNGAATAYLEPLVKKYNNVYLWPQTYNLGVARSWNYAFDQIKNDYIIQANDDVEVEPRTIEYLVTAAKNNPKEIFFSGEQDSGNAFSLFLLTQRGYELIGAFDEDFYPAYYEDDDYAYRMKLKGYRIIPVHGATYFHVGSSTLKSYTPQEMDMHHNSFRANQARYKRKWGGLPRLEEFTTAFNN
jgi:GT2 family glycosyltransferase